MSQEQPRVRIVARPAAGGKTELLTQDPRSGREIATGMTVAQGQVEKNINQLKEIFERSGSRPEVHEAS